MDSTWNNIPKIQSVVYVVFDITQGPIVEHQAPECQTPSKAELIDFSTSCFEVSGHVVIRGTPQYKLLGYPTVIYDSKKYADQRNAFLFNLVFVFEPQTEVSMFQPVLRKIGRSLRFIEDTLCELSRPRDLHLYSVIEQLYLDLNRFSEARIALPGFDLNLVLYPFYKNPPAVEPWHVPVDTVNLKKLRHPSWDNVLHRVCDYIDGIRTAKQISQLADIDIAATCEALRHFVYYQAVDIIDMFQFTNVYVPLKVILDAIHDARDTAEFENAMTGFEYPESDSIGATAVLMTGYPFLTDENSFGIGLECEMYVYNGTDTARVPPVSFPELLRLYAKLSPGLSVQDWVEDNAIYNLPIDVRRFISFGVTKKILRRCHSHPIWLHEHLAIDAPPDVLPSYFEDTSEGSPTQVVRIPLSLVRLLDGTHNTDEIAVTYGIPFRELSRILKVIGHASPLLSSVLANSISRSFGADHVHVVSSRNFDSTASYGTVFMIVK